jgi:hypothetical protein
MTVRWPNRCTHHAPVAIIDARRRARCTSNVLCLRHRWHKQQSWLLLQYTSTHTAWNHGSLLPELLA